MSRRFILIGAAGYIAPRHMEAIQKTGNVLVAAYDPSDSVGILDRYFPEARFFTDKKDLETFLSDQKIDYVSICSPNYLHAEHIQLGLKHGADVICEKPLVLTEKELDELLALEKKSGKHVYTVLQLRFHDAIIKLKQQVANSKNTRHQVKLTYLTSRGHWYHASWKGDVSKSGGLSTNIGVHFFDMLTWIFGDAEKAVMHERTDSTEKGFLQLQNADVEWTLSIDRSLLPTSAVEQGKTTFRSIQIDGKEFEFSDGFTELHQTVYNQVLNGQGYGIADARAAIRIVESMRGLK